MPPERVLVCFCTSGLLFEALSPAPSHHLGVDVFVGTFDSRDLVATSGSVGHGHFAVPPPSEARRTLPCERGVSSREHLRDDKRLTTLTAALSVSVRRVLVRPRTQARRGL
jgi:hypothetical protein